MPDGITFTKEKPMCLVHPTERVKYIHDLGNLEGQPIESDWWCRLCLKELLEREVK